MEYKGSAQEKADRKYREKIAQDEALKHERNKKSYFRSAKAYITKYADSDGLIELKKLIAEKEKEF